VASIALGSTELEEPLPDELSDAPFKAEADVADVDPTADVVELEAEFAPHPNNAIARHTHTIAAAMPVKRVVVSIASMSCPSVSQVKDSVLQRS
jgi:hypothetical protein